MPIETQESFAAYVRRVRLAKNFSQQQVERNGGPKQGTISDYETSADTATPKVPTRRMVILFARGLQEDMAEVEKKAGFLPGAARPPVSLHEVQNGLEEAGRIPSLLSTGDVVYLATDDPDPDETLAALEGFLTGWRQGWQTRDARKRRRAGGATEVDSSH